MRPAPTAVLKAYNYLRCLNPRVQAGSRLNNLQVFGQQGRAQEIAYHAAASSMGSRECLANEADCGQELVRQAGIGKVAVLTSEAMPEEAGMAMRTFPVDLRLNQ